MLQFFHRILTSCAKSNTRIAMGMTPNCSARPELTFPVPFYLLNNNSKIFKSTFVTAHLWANASEVKIQNFLLFLQKLPSCMFEFVLNKPLLYTVKCF